MMVQTEIGLLPEDWKIKTLENIGSFTKGSGISRSDSLSGRIPAVRYGELYTDHDNYIKTFHSFISPEVAKTSRKMKQGCILFTASGETKEDIGKAVAFLDDFEAYAGGDLIILNPKGDYSSQYLGYTLNSPSSVRQKAMMAQGDSVVHITTGSVQKVTVPIPSSTEQQNIASALSSIDKLIDDLGRTIQKKQRIREGAMEELLSGKKRLPGFTEEWVEKKIGEVCNTASGGTPSRSNPNYYTGKIKWFTTTELNDGWLLDSIEHISEEAIRNSSAKIFKEGTLLMAMYGATIGKLGILSSEAATNQACCAFESKEMDIIFLFYFLFAKRQQILSLGAGAGQPNISQQIIKNIPINIPPIKEQHAIADILTSMDDEISLLESERAKYEQIRSGMMEELLTGKKRLK